MSHNIADMLSQLTTEAAVVDMPTEGPIEELDSSLMDQADGAGEPTVASIVEDLKRSEDLGGTLNDIADRAEVVETQLAKTGEDAPSETELKVAEITVEGLVREYGTTVRAFGMQSSWQSYSTEAAQTPIERATAIKNDSRKFGGIANQAALSLGDVSTESSGIVKVLGRHKARLETARAALQNASRRVEANIAELKDQPKIIHNNGVARFMTRHNGAVTNLPAAIKEEAAWMAKAHSAIHSAMAAIHTAVAKVKANPELTIEQILSSGEFKAINELSTSVGFLMGNHTVEIKKSEVPVPYYYRHTKDIHSTVGSRVAGGIFAVAGGVASGNTATLLTLAIGGPAIGPIVAAAAGGVALGKTMSRYVKDRSSVTSAASAQDMKQVFDLVLAYNKYTDATMDWNVFNELDDAHSATKSKAIGALSHAAWNVYVVSEILYDQALYTTTRLAILARDIS